LTSSAAPFAGRVQQDGAAAGDQPAGPRRADRALTSSAAPSAGSRCDAPCCRPHTSRVPALAKQDPARAAGCVSVLCSPPGLCALASVGGMPSTLEWRATCHGGPGCSTGRRKVKAPCEPRGSRAGLPPPHTSTQHTRPHSTFDTQRAPAFLLRLAWDAPAWLLRAPGLLALLLAAFLLGRLCRVRLCRVRRRECAHRRRLTNLALHPETFCFRLLAVAARRRAFGRRGGGHDGCVGPSGGAGDPCEPILPSAAPVTRVAAPTERRPVVAVTRAAAGSRQAS
jgi:hypothetical protein